jgi:aryl sulfotransferase
MGAADKTIVWIASYPKSGNTWVRFLSCNLLFGPQESAAALNRLAPDLHELGPHPLPPSAPQIMKTHFPFSPLLPLAGHTAGAIYVVRDPADVMLSNFHYSRRSGAGTGDGAVIAGGESELSAYVDRYLNARGDPRWIRLGMGTWGEHVRSWLAVRHPFPVMLVRYEALSADPLQVARGLCAFLGVSREEAEVARAVQAASFERLKEIEEADIHRQCVGIFYKPYLRQSIDAGLRFMRAGRSGDGAKVLTPETRRRLLAAFGPLMQELGYGV